jgi:positive regulator of sigma E activity
MNKNLMKILYLVTIVILIVLLFLSVFNAIVFSEIAKFIIIFVFLPFHLYITFLWERFGKKDGNE